MAAGAGPGRTTRTMDVIFWILGQIIIKYMTHAGNMQAARGHICSNQDLLPPFSKIPEQFLPFMLWDITRKHAGGIVFAFEALS